MRLCCEVSRGPSMTLQIKLSISSHDAALPHVRSRPVHKVKTVICCKPCPRSSVPWLLVATIWASSMSWCRHMRRLRSYRVCFLRLTSCPVGRSYNMNGNKNAEAQKNSETVAAYIYSIAPLTLLAPREECFHEFCLQDGSTLIFFLL